MTFFNGVLLVVPLRPNEKALDRKAIEWLREDYDAAFGRFSPDGRYRAFDQATFDTFADGYRHLVKSVKTTLPATRITLIQPSPR